jgi:hypothetical protein
VPTRPDALRLGEMAHERHNRLACAKKELASL